MRRERSGARFVVLLSLSRFSAAADNQTQLDQTQLDQTQFHP